MLLSTQDVCKNSLYLAQEKKTAQENDMSNGIKKANPITEGTTPTCKPPMALQGLDVKKPEMLFSNNNLFLRIESR